MPRAIIELSHATILLLDRVSDDMRSGNQQAATAHEEARTQTPETPLTWYLHDYGNNALSEKERCSAKEARLLCKDTVMDAEKTIRLVPARLQRHPKKSINRPSPVPAQSEVDLVNLRWLRLLRFGHGELVVAQRISRVRRRRSCTWRSSAIASSARKEWLPQPIIHPSLAPKYRK